MTYETYKNTPELYNEWRVVAIAKDMKGIEFLAIAEHKKYPFYGVQFHPEKNAFDWSRDINIDHSFEGI